MIKTNIDGEMLKTLTTPNSLEDALNNFYIIDEYVKNNKITLTVDLAIDLINLNTKISKSLDIIFEKHKNSIITNQASKTFKSKTLPQFINAYCLINNIAVNEIEDFDLLPSHIKSYFKDIAAYSLLTREEEIDLANKALAGDKRAKDKLICSNLRLVINYVKNYFSFYDPMDLIQEGNLGLMKAAERFDPSKGYRFATYAMNWIRQRTHIYITEKQGTLYLPFWMKKNWLSYRKAKKDFFLQYNKEPNLDELLAMTKLSPEILELVMDYDQCQFISMDARINDDDQEPAFLQLPSKDNVEEEVLNKIESYEIRELLDKAHLTEQEKTILLYRYGFIDNRTHKLEEIGKIYKVSKQRIGQLEKLALIKIRNYVKRTDIDYFNSKQR